MSTAPKPPIGLRPRWAADRQRANEILEAMMRYVDAGTPIPSEWMKELEELAGRNPDAS